MKTYDDNMVVKKEKHLSKKLKNNILFHIFLLFKKNSCNFWKNEINMKTICWSKKHFSKFGQKDP